MNIKTVHWLQSFNFRGKDFRPDYAKVACLRSLSPAPVLCLTATCTEGMQKSILSKLSIQVSDIDFVSTLPDRPNIFLNFKSSRCSIEEEIDFYLNELSVKGINARKAIIFCPTIKSVSDNFRYVNNTLGSKAFHLGLRKQSHILVSMYHSSVTPSLKSVILSTFRLPDSHIRLIITTIAFGMGVDIPDIHLIIHWGASKSLLAYWQEVGRAGRDNQTSQAIFLPGSRSTDTRRISKEMVNFCKQLEVRLI